MRVPAQARKPRTAKFTTFSAPTGGWVANRNLAQPNQYGQQPGAAVLENWFPLATSLVMRRGTELYATLSGSIGSLFGYINGTNLKLFCANATNIYDITDGASPSSAVASLTSGAWSVVQFETSGGVFLRGVNGADTPFVFDGTTWGTTPAITFTDGTTADQLSNVWASQKRLWFVKLNSLTAYYLAPDSIGGAANAFPLGDVFTRGGSLLFGAQWSIETLGGLVQNCVFISTEGEAAVYQGSDPSSATTWSLIGVYRIGRPLGPKAWIRAGGDLVIATDIGFVPLSQAMQRDYSALSPSAVSYAIETEWNDTVAERAGTYWNCEVWPTNQMVIVAPPTTTGTTPEMYVTNARTGAWAKFTTWDATCLVVWNERFFYGTSAGTVIEGNVSGADQGVPFTATYIPLFDDLRSPGSLKISKMARAVFREGVPVNEKVTMNVDFDTSTPTVPDATPVGSVSAWGSGVWGQSTWGSANALATQQNWQSIGATGYALAPCVQVTSGDVVPLDTQLVRVDVTYEVADVVT